MSLLRRLKLLSLCICIMFSVVKIPNKDVQCVSDTIYQYTSNSASCIAQVLPSCCHLRIKEGISVVSFIYKNPQPTQTITPPYAKRMENKQINKQNKTNNPQKDNIERNQLPPQLIKPLLQPRRLLPHIPLIIILKPRFLKQLLIPLDNPRHPLLH